MKASGYSKTIAIFVAAVGLSACATQNQQEVLLSKKPATELRAMQSRAFDTGDKSKVFRAVISTFQDLGYTIMDVQPDAGTVTGDKLSMLKLTAAVYARGEDRTIVRANAIVKVSPAVPQGHQVDAPEFYQQRFFEPLSKALFLTALDVKDDDASIPAPKVKFDPPSKPEDAKTEESKAKKASQ